MDNKWTQRALAAAVLGGLLAFLWCFSDLLGKTESWDIAWNPPSVGELLRCVCYGLVAVGAALGLDVPNLLSGFGFALKKGE